MEEQVDSKDLEQQLKQWREERGRKPVLQSSSPASGRRTVRVNGQSIVVVKRPRSKTSG
jgi:hypothetical protein